MKIKAVFRLVTTVFATSEIFANIWIVKTRNKKENTSAPILNTI